MHKRGLCRHAVSVHPSIHHVRELCQNKHIFEIFLPLGSHTILVFPYQMGWRYSNGNPAIGGIKRRWGRQKTLFWTSIWLRCIQLYSVINCTSRKVWRIKPRRSVEPSTHRGVRRWYKATMKSLWGVWRYTPETKGGQTFPDTTPLVITPFSAAVGHHGTEPGGYFCWKLTLSRTPDFIQPTSQGPDPNRPTNGSKKGGYDLGVFVQGVLVGHCRRQ